MLHFSPSYHVFIYTLLNPYSKKMKIYSQLCSFKLKSLIIFLKKEKIFSGTDKSVRQSSITRDCIHNFKMLLDHLSPIRVSRFLSFISTHSVLPMSLNMPVLSTFLSLKMYQSFLTFPFYARVTMARVFCMYRFKCPHAPKFNVILIRFHQLSQDDVCVDHLV